MNKDQYDIYLENFVIMREDKKRKDGGGFMKKKLENVQNK